MSDGKLVTLRQMQLGQKGKVAQIQGGFRLVNRLNALGVRPGTRITKISALAVGFGMANKIIVELD